MEGRGIIQMTFPLALCMLFLVGNRARRYRYSTKYIKCAGDICSKEVGASLSGLPRLFFHVTTAYTIFSIRLLC